jgi:methylated-DNA-[protein]-cysteine S-methyltransferase
MESVKAKKNVDTWYYQSPVGLLEIRSTESLIRELLFCTSPANSETKTSACPETVLRCMQQLDEYFQGRRKNFDFPFLQDGTSFQKKVWDELAKIPYGKTISYLELSRRIGDTRSIRAVGSANGKNSLVIVVPCHRVIGANGDLVGFGGGLWRKKWLLEHEDRFENGVQVLFSHDVKDFSHKG